MERKKKREKKERKQKKERVKKVKKKEVSHKTTIFPHRQQWKKKKEKEKSKETKETRRGLRPSYNLSPQTTWTLKFLVFS